MAQVKRFKAKKPFKLDCGHPVNAGDEFVVKKFFCCEADARKLGFQQAGQPQEQK